MTRRLRCRECNHPMTVELGSRARPTPLGILRQKRCTACGARTTTVELAVSDIPKLALAYMTVDQQN